MDESRLASERLSTAVDFCKRHISYISYVVLAAIVWLSMWIRTRNLPGLRDISTGGWTLGPDLDPFLFLRWAKAIVANGSLYAIDTLRYVPLGFHTKSEFIFLSYLIAWFHKIAAVFGSVSVEQSAVWFPVIMFGLTVVAFFLFVRKLFVSHVGNNIATVISLIASLFLSVTPALLPRTIAGIPEKESVAFLFMFLAFYFMLQAWYSQSNAKRFTFTFLAALATAGMGLIWGGVLYVFITFSIVFLAAFLLNQLEGSKQLMLPVWFVLSAAIMMPFSTRYTLSSIISSQTTSIPLAICVLIGVNYLLFGTGLKDKIPAKFSSIPPKITSAIATAIVLLAGLFILQGPSGVITPISHLVDKLIHPFTQTRFNITVAENRMPFFSEWTSSFGPYILGVPIIFWLFIIGSIYLFHSMVSVFEKREQRILTVSYIVFLFALIFSRYSESSILNGENFISNLLYFGGMLVFVGAFVYSYWKYFRHGNMDNLKNMDFGLLLLFSLFFLSIVSARGGVRLIMMLVPPVSIIASYLVVQIGAKIRHKAGGMKSLYIFMFAIILLGSIFAAIQFTRMSEATAQGYVPSAYTQQWQKAMGWVRENTPQNAVFGHWWDYGYWVQSMGERATVLDGGNSYVYWNHFMGRYALTGPNEKEALSFLYAHNATHFLIDSTDIGKYPAFSSIGSDQNYDRYSWITAFTKDNSQTQERKNSTIYLYTGSFVFDDDFIYNLNGTKVFIPYGKGGVGAVSLEKFSDGTFAQPRIVAVYNGRQYALPLRYLHYNNELVDYGSGVDAGVMMIPLLQQSSMGATIDRDGALMYLSNKTVRSQLAKLYLYGQQTSAFKLAHSEDDFLVAQLKSQGMTSSDFVFYGDIRGPIKIWEINYPAGMQLNSTYIDPVFPNPELEVVSR